MELNWKAWKIALIFAALTALSSLVGALMTFDVPPTLWQAFKLAIGPAIISFISTLIQVCARVKLGNGIKAAVIVLAVVLTLSGCASLNPQISKFDLANYEANKQLAVDQMKTWSFNSGFIGGLGLTNKIAFPIRSAGELRAVINSPTVLLAIVDLDEVCKKLGYWRDLDYDLGFSLGAKARGGSQAAIEFVRSFFPQLMRYAPALFGI